MPARKPRQPFDNSFWPFATRPPTRPGVLYPPNNPGFPMGSDGGKKPTPGPSKMGRAD
jgi:hypothetical protein